MNTVGKNIKKTLYGIFYLFEEFSLQNQVYIHEDIRSQVAQMHSRKFKKSLLNNRERYKFQKCSF